MNKNPKTENLIPLSARNPTEKKELQQKGGKISAKVRQERKKLKDELRYLLNVEDKTGKTMQEKMCLSLVKNAIDGDLNAVEWIQACIGEKPIEKTMSLSPTLEAKTEAQQIVADIIAKQIS